ncbi:MAG: hypothetical protein J2O47_05160, partial [Acidimicrobiaceae bacterium]|nr:hypothetical protein [Acidimicrobiaceae bacterium]
MSGRRNVTFDPPAVVDVDPVDVDPVDVDPVDVDPELDPTLGPAPDPAVAKAPLLRPLAGRRSLQVVPNLSLEKSLWEAGDDVVVGMDE